MSRRATGPARDLTWEDVLEWIALPWRARPCELTVVDVWPQAFGDDPKARGPGALRVLGQAWLHFEHTPGGLVTWWGQNDQGETYDFNGLRRAILAAWKIHDKEALSRAGYGDDEDIPGF